MRSHASPKESSSNAAKPFFSRSSDSTAATTPFFVPTRTAAVPDLQAQTELKEPEEQLQRKEAAGAERDVPASSPPPPEEPPSGSVQAKLTMGEPGDRFEREADPVVQRKCTACQEEDDKLRRQAETSDEHELVQFKTRIRPVQAKLEIGGTGAESPPNVQAECSACADKGIKLQPKFSLGAPGDRFEQEADRTADVVMRSSAPIGELSAAQPADIQRDGAETCRFEDDKEKGEEDVEQEDPVPNEKEDIAESKPDQQVSPKRVAVGGALTPDLETGIDASRGGGSPLGDSTREFMESRFGYDFSGVRVHTGAQSAGMNREIRSHAFTSGSDIFFGAGQYRPDTDSGKHLLAHELTHVVQQTGPRGGNNIVREKADPEVVSRALDSSETKWYHSHRVSGTQVHGELGKILRGADKELVTEAAIPGANRYSARLNNTGRADLYKSIPEHTVTGIKGYREVASLDDLVSMNSPEANDTQPAVTSSPRLELPAGITKAKSKGVKRQLVGDFPEEITLGEIKPADTSKLADGWAQLDHYQKGYGDFVRQISTITGGKTRNSVRFKRLNLMLPDALNFDKFESQAGTAFKPATFGVRRLWVGEVGHGSGIYLYDDLAAQGLSGQPQEWHSKYWPKLLRVRAALTIKHKGSQKMGQTKPLPGAPKVVQRDTDPAQWEKERQEFAGEFRGAMKAKHQNYRDKLRFERKLGKAGKTLGPDQKTEVREYKSMMFWSGFGGKVVGKVRFLLGGVWDKAVEIFEKMKKKMHGLRDRVRKISESDAAGISWAKRLIKVVVAASKIAVAAFITESFNFFADCFQSAMDKVVDKFKDELLNTELGQKLCHAHKEYVKFKDKLETEWDGSLKKLEELWTIIQDTTRWIDYATTVIDLIRIGVQVVSCLTPPALGCLWGLVAQIGISAALGIVVGTQWFNDNIVVPPIRALVRKYAAPHYQSLINRVLGDNLKEYHCHLADENFPSLNFEYKDGLKPGTKEMEDHRQAWEKEHESEMIADLQKVFTKKDGKPVTKENLQEFVKQVQAKRLNQEQVKQLIDQSRDPASSKIYLDNATEQASQGSGTPSAQPRKERNIDYSKASRSNVASRKVYGWDPMTFYKNPVVKVESEEFANAIYDLQQSLGIKADGIVGHDTLIAFYDRNKLEKNQPYKDAVRGREQERAAKEKAEKELEEKRKAAADKAKGPGAKAGFKEIDASACKLPAGHDQNTPSGVKIYIHSPDPWDFIKAEPNNRYTMKYEPKHLTLDVFVGDKHEYRVVNVAVSRIGLWRLLSADPVDPVTLDAFFTDGIELSLSTGLLSIAVKRWRVN